MSDVTTQTIPMYPDGQGGWGSVADVPPPTGEIQSFDINNTEASTSPGLIRQGLVFKQGDIPVGSVPVISRGGSEVVAQFDCRNTWPDGSLRFAVCHIRDASFPALSAKTYSVTAEVGAYDNTSLKTVADVIENTNFSIALSNVTDVSGTYNGGTLISLFNSAGATPRNAARVTQVHSGPVCDGYKVWGYFDGETTDADMKAIWHVNAWKDVSGEYVDYEYGAVIAQDWWVSASKNTRNYNAELKADNVTTESYAGVSHVYHSNWFTVDLDSSTSRYGKRKWMTTAPTLIPVVDMEYWQEAGLIDQYDLSLDAVNSGNVYDDAYAPCLSMNHRAGIDATGAYMGRGMVPNVDAIAIISQDPTRIKHARTNAFAGLHIPYQTRDQRTEDANTIMPVNVGLLTDAPSASYPGLAGPLVFSIDPRTPAYNQGWTTPSDYGEWNPSGDSSHAVAYSYYMSLLEGEYYLMEANLQLYIATICRRTGDQYGQLTKLGWANDSVRGPLMGIPQDNWTGISLTQTSNARGTGWALNILSAARATVPDDGIELPVIDAASTNVLDWLEQTVDYFPPDIMQYGMWTLGATNQLSTWMYGLIFLGMDTVQNRLAIALPNCNEMIINYWTYGYNDPGPLWQASCSYKMLALQDDAEQWDPTTNPVSFPYFFEYWDATGDPNTDTFTFSNSDKRTFTENDPIKWCLENGSQGSVPVAAGYNTRDVYYIVNLVGQETCQLALSPGGQPLPVTDSVQGSWRGRCQATAATPRAANAAEDDYQPMAIASARQHCFLNPDNTALNAARELGDAHMSTYSPSSWFTWAYKIPETP